MATSIPSITIFTKHSPTCPDRLEGGTWRRCRCRKSLRWFHAGKQYKKSVKSRSWEAAEEARRELEKKFEAGSTPTELPTDSRVTLARAVELYTMDRETSGKLTDGVLKKIKRELKRFQSFMELRSVLFPADVQTEHLIQYRATWKSLYPSTATQIQVQARLRAFLRFCHDGGYIGKLPKLSPIEHDAEPKLPLSKKQYSTLLEKMPSVFSDGRKIQRVRALLQLMRHTGLAIRDAVTLKRTEIEHDKKKGLYRVKTSRQKTGEYVYVPLQPAVATEILSVENSNPDYLFWTGNGLETSAVTGWQHDLRTLFRAVFGKDTKFTPHCLRDTFAVESLLAGIPIEQVAELLGHSNPKTTLKSYKPWVKELQDRLDRIVMATWAGAQQ